MGIIQAIVAALKAFGILADIFKSIARMFRKDPVKQIQDAEKAHDEAAKKAERNDDTSGSFGG